MSVKFSKAQWNRMQDILDAVLDLEGADREKELRRRCGTDQQLYTDISQLLAHESDAPSYLDNPALDLINTRAGSNTNESFATLEKQIELDDSIVDSYRLCEPLGAGGMGVVYRAERNRGDFEQQVAIKFLSHWQGNRAQVERFQREQQLLADLQHPRIAKLFDGGLTERGQPYLIMEYVSGKPIDQYCEQQQLNIEQRLNLLLQIIEALDYAHNHLIVHRDIKPTNILVNEDGEIKLLDFGVAKLLGDEDPNLTRTGEQVLTPGFAAPEQLQNQTITVATDIYQLGLVAYELLTGRQAYRDKAESMLELVKVICDGAPTLPSEILLSVPAENDSENGFTKFEFISEAERRHWSKKLSGEVDAIVLKMLHNEPAQRYRSMGALQADLQAYFEHRPISAHSQSIVYLLNKTARRHWKSLATISAFVVLLLAYATTVSIQAAKIQTALDASKLEREKAQNVADFMIDMFKAADPNVSGLETVTAQELLERGQTKVIDDLELSPEIQAQMLTSLGEIYFSQGKSAKSEELLETALLKQRASAQDDDLGLARTLTQLAIVYSNTNKYDEAAQYFTQSLNLYHSSQSEQELSVSVDYAELNNVYGLLQLRLGKLSEAEDRIRKAIATLERGNHQRHSEYAVALNNLASVKLVAGDLKTATQYRQAAVAEHEKSLGENHSYFSIYLINLGNLYTKLGRYDEAEPVFNRALALQKKVLGESHPYVSHSLRNLGVLYHATGEVERAEQHLREALAVRTANFSVATLMTATVHLQLSDVLMDTGRFSEAQTHLNTMRDMHRELKAGDQVVGLGLCSVARMAFLSRDLDAAEDYFQQAIALLETTTLRKSIAQIGLARVQLEKGQFDQALMHAEDSLATRLKELPAGHGQIAEAQAVAGLTLARQGNHAQAKQMLLEAGNILTNSPLYQYGGQASLSQQVAVTLERL